MRKSLAIAICLSATFAVQAQRVTLQSPTSISIPLQGESASLKVFYTITGTPEITLTEVGQLDSDELKLEAPKPVAGAVNWLKITVTPKKHPLVPGDTLTGALVFTEKDQTPERVPVTVTRPKPTYTVSMKDADVCLGCGEPRVLAIEITNTGQVPIEKVQIGAIRFSDANRKHRWILPSSDKCAPSKTPVAKPDAVPACNEATIALAPTQTHTMLVSIDPPPPYAGDYATTFDVSAPGAQTVNVSAITRLRGPRGATSWPFWLFVIIVVIGGVLAHLLEYYFGTGGGDLRAKALMSLYATLDELELIKQWVQNEGKLISTAGRIVVDILEVETIVRNADQRAPGKLDEEAATYAERLEKRRRLQQKVEEAKVRAKDKIDALDKEEDFGNIQDYEKRLNAIINEPVKKVDLVPPPETPEVAAARRESERKRLRWQRRWMKVMRGVTLALVSLASAYLALYYNKCSFGSIADYIIAFFWALGLTQAGFSLIGEGTSKYKPAT